ncbi:hypothetical protein [Sulfitobacter sp. 1A16808]|uniref:hypothetical protein n=1 Tax=Sulfitobacter sp. 1A16808 TaxID=3368572 RepID=UPI003746BBEA
MSKKTFTAAPKPKQPSADDIDAFERGGAGHDQRPVPVASVVAPQKPAEPTKRLSLDLPASVHTRFKTACSATGRKMVSEIQDFIEERTAQLEAEAGISRE